MGSDPVRWPLVDGNVVTSEEAGPHTVGGAKDKGGDTTKDEGVATCGAVGPTDDEGGVAAMV